MITEEILNIDTLIKYADKKQYSIFDTGKYNLNIWAIRSDNNRPGTFDDKEIVFWKQDGEWRHYIFNCTTDPGKHYLQNLLNPSGTAIIYPDQYSGCFRYGYHKGDKTHPALIQAKPVKVFRDGNRDLLLDYQVYKSVYDGVFDYKPNTHGGEDITAYIDSKLTILMQTGYFGINNHRAHEHYIAKKVGRYSAGCIVIQDPKEYYSKFIPTLESAKEEWGDTFTITVVTERDIRHLLSI